MSTNHTPFPLTIRQLAKRLGGVPLLGQLPPRDRDLSLVQRVVFELAACQPGSVYWDLHDPADPDAVHPDMAYFHGALGVISCHRSEPWAGCFSIQLPDNGHQPRLAARLALEQWMVSIHGPQAQSAGRPSRQLATR